MERTGSFRNAVKAVQKRRSSDVGGAESDAAPDPDRILKTNRKKRKLDPFEAKGRAIVENVTRLRDFLGENRDAYVDVLNSETAANGVGPITDIDRDRIDAGANVFIKTINKLISNFKEEVKKEVKNLTAQRVKHLEVTTDILDGYLRSACDIYSRQKAIRVEKELEMQSLSRLETNARKRCHSPSQDRPSTATAPASPAFSAESEDDEGGRGRSEDADCRVRRRRKKGGVALRKDARSVNTFPPPAAAAVSANGGYLYSSDDDEDGVGDRGLTGEEVKLYERENEALYEDLINMKDSVKLVENKVVKIAELQEVFTEKILQQKDDIDLIAGYAVASTENVKDGNEELRKAIQRNASLRVYILFFLLVMSFSLLFLDWYNV